MSLSTLLKSFINISNFSVDSCGKLSFENNDSFVTFITTFTIFISFSLPTALMRTASVLLNRIGNNTGFLYLDLDFWRKYFKCFN